MVNTCAHTGVRTSVAVKAVISCLVIHTYCTYTQYCINLLSNIPDRSATNSRRTPNIMSTAAQRDQGESDEMPNGRDKTRLRFARPATEITTWQ